MKTKLIAKYTHSHLAHIHKGVLEENGIQAFIFGENFMGAAPYFSGILNAGMELRVREEDYEKSMDLLASERKNQVKCANCHSENIVFSFGENKFKIILFSILSAILLVLPFGNFQRQYFCKECGFKTRN
jgi:cytochrome c